MKPTLSLWDILRDISELSRRALEGTTAHGKAAEFCPEEGWVDVDQHVNTDQPLRPPALPRPCSFTSLILLACKPVSLELIYYTTVKNFYSSSLREILSFPYAAANFKSCFLKTRPRAQQLEVQIPSISSINFPQTRTAWSLKVRC